MNVVHSDDGIKIDTLLYSILCAGTFPLHILYVFIFLNFKKGRGEKSAFLKIVWLNIMFNISLNALQKKEIDKYF